MNTEHDIREILAEARKIEILTRRDASESLSGAYHSTFKGSGIEFEEVREYIPGDDVRSIDWNVTAKTGKPFIKRFREERELTVMLAVDISASLDFGSTRKSKRYEAARVAAVLAYSAMANNDKVGLLLFADGPLHFVAPRKDPNQLSRIVRDILRHPRRRAETDIASAMDHLNKLFRKHAIVFIISDFLVPAATEEETFKAIRLSNKRHDVIAVDMHDPREADLPDVGRITLEDAETGNILTVNTANGGIRRRFARHSRERREALQRSLRQCGVDRMQVTAGESFLKTLRGFFRRREGRR